MDAGHTCAPADKRKDRIRVLGRSSFRTDLRVGNGTAQQLKPNRQPKASGLVQQAKMLPWLRMELFESARHQRYTAGRFVGSATYSRIAEMTFPSIRIQSPSDGSIHSRSHSVVAEARNTKVPASQAGQVMPRQPKIWFSVSSARSVLQSVYLTQQSPNVPCTFRSAAIADSSVEASAPLPVPTGSGDSFMSEPSCWSCDRR